MLQMIISGIVVLIMVGVFYTIAEITAVRPGRDFDVDPNMQDPFWPSARFWWVLTHVLESYWIERSTLPQVMSLMMTLFNLVVFAALIGLFGTWIQGRLAQLRRGTSRVLEEGHIVILGWSGKVIPVIRELNEGLESKKKVFVLHTEHPMEEIEGRLKRSFGRNGPRFVVRQGSMTDMKDIDILNISSARTIIMLSRNDDASIVKSIMAVTHLIEADAPSRPPSLIVEIENNAMVRLARAAARSLEISTVLPSDYLSRIILQTARQRRLVNVYDEILSHYGNELHFDIWRGGTACEWRTVVFSYRKAVPIGVVRNHVPYLAPTQTDATFRVEPGDCIVGIAATDKDMLVDSTNPPPTSRFDTCAGDAVNAVTSLLILGWNDKSLLLLREYGDYARTSGEIHHATVVSQSIPDWVMDSAFRDNMKTLDVKLLREDALSQGVLERLEPEAFDSIIVLGEQRSQHGAENADTRVILLLLLLRSMRDRTALLGTPYPDKQQIVSEILDVSNKALAESTGAIQDVIISNDLVSKMIAQICRDVRTEPVMRDLFDECGKELYIKPATWYIAAGNEVGFNQFIDAALARGEIAIGVSLTRCEYCDIRLNPPRDLRWHVDDTLSLVVVSESDARPEAPRSPGADVQPTNL